MDFNIGDKVKVEVNGKEYQGPIRRIEDGLYIIETGLGELHSFLYWQLTRVEESKWLLTKEQRIDAMNTSGQCCKDCGAAIALAAARHVVEELWECNRGLGGTLCLGKLDWAELQKAVGLWKD